MPRFFWYLSQLIPTTWMIDAARGVILRGAGWSQLWASAGMLWVMALVSMTASAMLFKKRVK
jgi:ABC-2 type transport system permease protein